MTGANRSLLNTFNVSDSFMFPITFVDVNGEIYVTDAFHSRIVRFDSMTGANAVTSALSSGTDQFPLPGSSFSDSAGPQVMGRDQEILIGRGR
jgi:hypothetical protein